MNHFAKRIIPCLDINEGKVVKGVNFVGLKDMGDPILMAKKYNDAGADELVFLDISASYERRNTMVDIVSQVAKVTFIPLTIGGGIKTLDNIYSLLDVGADKISLNSAAIKNPDLITEGAKRFGSQCIVAAIDIKKHPTQLEKWEVYIQGGRENTGKDMIEWAKEVSQRGAGEILLTSMDTDGTKCGYDIKALKMLDKAVNIPIIASGGAGTKEHILEIFNLGIADAALAASIFHLDEITIKDLKSYLHHHNIPIRL
ncbi:imidazole glycerol phosphate synthase subunit HisF [Helicobacter cappadocius]|uniref:Imidazole glycerol phosphate synthase subunit HisF n=1 Tax=Helicobacter cappadocius TaxID=3063998 RepID=A0AA90Q1D9_9HELI|nr:MULTISPECIES: imidazole glycerol phosphate synthase subunit HisF [unclassified Helicobacter]MDO7252511.1 imidazole glycerol phosphate synthase subunit HisF [Helicobacter sp. faydin-H75]MDP2538378.1 imidazole glycerol phosphate synthase subunit HisF [Helicobacter sp. faydin-H76]